MMSAITLTRRTILADVRSERGASRSHLAIVRTGQADATDDASGGGAEAYSDSAGLLASPEIDAFSASVESAPDAEPASDDPATIETMAKKATPAKIKKATPPTSTGVSVVKQIQTALKSLGYDLGAFGPKKDGVDGVIGAYTRGAIVKFKKDNGISPANATIDAAFRSALDAKARAAGGAGVTPSSGPPAAAAVSGAGVTGWIIAGVAAIAAVVAYVVLKK